MSSSMVASPRNPNFSETKPSPAARPIAAFKPSPWGDRFLDYTPDNMVIEAQEKMHKELKEEIKRELLAVVSDKPLMEQLCLIDSIERLGVAYQFEKEIEDALRCIHEMSNTASDDIFLTSLRFRLLRQHGFNVSSDIFRSFIGSNESVNEAVASDVQGMLNLYEACCVRGHGDSILDEALTFTTSKLKSMQGQLSHPLQEHVSHALKKALNKRLTRLECVRHLQVYKQDPLHNKTLLQFAKVDFNLLQWSQRKELIDMCRWWKHVKLTCKLPFRDRIVESYFWACAVYFEPQYSIGRKICTIACQIMTTIDDIYDAYATLDELEVFTKAVHRWDKSCLDELPQCLRPYYQALILDAYEEMEHDLAPKGRSQYVYHAREEMKALCQCYLVEATWRQKKHVPTFDEYMENAFRNSAFLLTTIFTFLDMDLATHNEFEWARKLPKPVEGLCVLVRLMDDIGGHKFDQLREHSSSAVQCYMRQYSVLEEEACKELYRKAEERWKDINQAMIPPTEVPMPLLKQCILNLARSVEVIYDGGEDGYTSVNNGMVQNIISLYAHPIPI